MRATPVDKNLLNKPKTVYWFKVVSSLPGLLNSTQNQAKFRKALTSLTTFLISQPILLIKLVLTLTKMLHFP